MKTRKNYSLGSLCVAAGCALRVLQLVTAYMGLGLSSNRIVYMAMLCLLVGGFAVLIYEKRGKASLFAVCAAVASLMTTVMGNMSDGADSLRVISAVLLYGMFVFAALVILMKRSGYAKTCGAFLMLLAAGLAVCSLCPVPAAAVMIMLCLSYALMGLGLNV